MKIYSIGIGPGPQEQITPQAEKALMESEVIVGYNKYFDYVRHLSEGKKIVSTGMTKERDRAKAAFDAAEQGKTVSVISSGDSGVYGMAPLLFEMKEELKLDVEIEVIPGISAMFAAAAKIGAPLGHDFCAISLSDLLTPWQRIEKRIIAAAQADFVTAIYNPVSKGRFWQLMRCRELFLNYRSEETPVCIARNVGRKDEGFHFTTLKELNASMADMFSVIIVGNSQSRVYPSGMVTPRGYFRPKSNDATLKGRKIMDESFQTILKEVDMNGKSLDHKWVALHCIHTTADLGMGELLELMNDAVPRIHAAFYSHQPPTIVTDVTMVSRGIRRAITQQLGITVKCYLEDSRAEELAAAENITRSQAGIRLAVEEYPNAVFVFGNAPTALLELVKLIKKGKARPTGVIAAPVGFVNVCESKYQLKYGCPDIPAAIIHGRKGGSNVAATIVNAILSWEDALAMKPGKGL